MEALSAVICCCAGLGIWYLISIATLPKCVRIWRLRDSFFYAVLCGAGSVIVPIAFLVVLVMLKLGSSPEEPGPDIAEFILVPALAAGWCAETLWILRREIRLKRANIAPLSANRFVRSQKYLSQYMTHRRNFVGDRPVR